MMLNIKYSCSPNGIDEDFLKHGSSGNIMSYLKGYLLTANKGPGQRDIFTCN
jgi:hypothetical protein